MSSIPVIAAFTAGAFAHLLYFKPYEHHLHGVRYIQFALLSLALAPLNISAKSEGGLQYSYGPILSRWIPIFVFIAGIYTSLLSYRIFFHPLNKFPGPFLARISDVWWSTQIVKADAPDKLVKLHEKYGPFVRIGSSSLSISKSEAMQAIYGPNTKCSKGPWYDQDSPYLSMHTTRSRAVHDKRRRIWSSGFSDKALRGYEDRIRPYADQLVAKWRALDGQPVNVTDWFNFFSFDAMGDLGFNASFKMLDKGEEHWAIKLLHEAMDVHALMIPEWLFRVIVAIPAASGDYWKFMKYTADALDNRIGQNPKIPDIMSSLLAPFQKTGPPKDIERTFLEGDTRLIIVAGSDTTAATFTYLFYHLCKNPEYITKLREETSEFVDPNGDGNDFDLKNCELLNGCINEALRLNPPVPTQVQRLTPPEGIEIAGQYIAGNCKVWAPQYVVYRNESVYKSPESFIPERWFSKPHLILDGGKSFAPFSLGPMACIGKPLALMELRTLTAKILTNFDVEFAPGEDGTKLMNETRNHFTLGLAPLKLTLKARKK